MADKLARAKLARAAKCFAHASGFGLPPLILMTDDERLADPLRAARELPRGSMIVLRARQTHHRHMLAFALKPVARARGLKFLIAGDADLAARIGADGIHLSEVRSGEASSWRARRKGWIITVSSHAPTTIGVTAADAIIVSPVFSTLSHPGTKPLGSMRLRLFSRNARMAVYPLGGISATSAQRLTGARLAGLAAIGALSV